MSDDLVWNKKRCTLFSGLQAQPLVYIYGKVNVANYFSDLSTSNVFLNYIQFIIFVMLYTVVFIVYATSKGCKYNSFPNDPFDNVVILFTGAYYVLEQPMPH